MVPLFDLNLRARRRDRAARCHSDRFLLDRAFADCLERLSVVDRAFESAMLLGCPDPEWPDRLRSVAARVDPFDPGPRFAAAAGGQLIVEDCAAGTPASHDLCVAVGTLDTVNDLPAALRWIRQSLRPDSLLIGAVAGGDTLPQLRSAMRAADSITGAAFPHVHPRIEAAAMAPLLAAAGFVMPVVDVDRVRVSYSSLGRLVADLRAMAATNILVERPRRSLSRRAFAAAAAAFAALGEDGRTQERFDILNFAAWTPSNPGHADQG